MSFSTEQAFAIKVCAGLAAGYSFILWSAWQHPDTKVKYWLDIYLGTLLGGLIAARLFYVLTHYESFLDNPLNIPRIWFGELAWQGAIIGGVLAVWGLCHWRKVNFGQFADGLALAFPIGFMAVCYASRSAGLLIGQPVANLKDKPVWMASFLPDITRDVVPRYELQLLGVVLAGLMLLIVTFFTLRNKLENRRLWLVLIMFGIVVFMLDTYSGSAGMRIGDIDLDQLGAGLLIVFAVIQSANRRENSVPQGLTDRL
jgi:prolipoprotein diacylglyceryltransferase